MSRRYFGRAIRFYSKNRNLDITDEADFAHRKQIISSLSIKDQILNYYPNIQDIKFQDASVTNNILNINKFRLKYENFFKATENETVKTLTNDKIVVFGKINSIRKSGKGMLFIDITENDYKLQLVLHHKLMSLTKDEFSSIHSIFKPGDFISSIGHPGRTNVGELSLKLTNPLKLASPSLHPLPPRLTDQSKINNNRVIDYLVNKKSRDVIKLRSKIIKTIRSYFESQDFIEVSTPIIGQGNTGANATPFITQSMHIRDKLTDKPIELNLRVAPELWLKRLIISGFDKIFEIGKNFRNEGIDSTHNPEFTSCEFYKTFTSLEELMNITEELFIKIINEILKDPIFKDISHNICENILKDLSQNEFKFNKIDFIKQIEIETKLSLPKILNSKNLIEYYNKLNIKLPNSNLSEFQLLDNLSSIYLEPLCKNIPTFIYNQPEIMSPLAKSKIDLERNYNISNRFEMFINGKEYVNAYEEENNPFAQKLKFEQQLKLKDEFNDQECIIPDYKYVESMEWGMPPTGGWGLGIDRLVMLLSGSERIENVLSFGKLNDVLRQ